MNITVREKLDSVIAASNRKKRWKTVVLSLCAVVAIITAYVLINPASTEKQVTYCGCTEHLSHTEDCYADGELVCTLPVHEHTLQCFSDPEADVEGADVWEKSLDKAELSGNRADDVVAIAATQVGYEESASNYAVQSDGTTMNGYTRYGEWFGNEYGDWDVMFCSFCMSYAGVGCDEIPATADRAAFAEALGGITDKAPDNGDIVFFDNDGDGVCDHVGLVSGIVTDKTTGAALKIKTIEGDKDNEVISGLYALGDEKVLGFAALPALPLEISTIQSQPASDGAIAVVSGNLPAGAEAVIEAVNVDLADYLGEDTAENVNSFVAYDIKVMVNGVEWQPESTLDVSVKKAGIEADENESFKAVHVDGKTEEAAEINADIGENGVSFKAEGFSVYIFYTFDDSNKTTLKAPILKSASYPTEVAYHDNYTWFTWGNGNGLVITNAPGNTNHIYLHYKTDDAGVGHFYCDEACTVECIGIGCEGNTTTWAKAINWAPMYNVDARINAYNFSTYDANFMTVATNASLAHDELLYSSPADFGMLGKMLYCATHKTPGIIMNQPLTNVTVDVIMHDTYVMTPMNSESHDAGSIDPPVYIASYMTNTNDNLFTGQLRIIRGSDLETAPLISLHMGYVSNDIHGYNMDYYFNFETGKKLIIDNKTTNPDAVAVEVNDGTLFMLTYGHITNSLSTGTPDTYQGIGVSLVNNHEDDTHLAAIELGHDNGGTCIIEKCRIAIDMKSGVTRFKQADATRPYTVADNGIAINMWHGTTLGKWSPSIDRVLSDRVLVTLADPEKWVAGDWLFTSGMMATAQGVVNTPLTEDDRARMGFTNYGDMNTELRIDFDKSIANNVDSQFPLFRLSDDVVYNTRTRKWYPNLGKAVTDTANLADGDTLVFYGNTKEPDPIVINNSITIRSAKKNTNDFKVKSDKAQDTIISELGYTAHLVGENGVTVAAGKTVYFGGADSGPLYFDGGAASRVLNVNGTAVANAGFTVQNGKAVNGGGVLINTGAAFGMYSGSAVIGNTAENGGGIYVDGGLLNVAGGKIGGNTAEKGAGVYQNGYFNIAADPLFENDVFLPSTATSDTARQKVITKARTLTNTVAIPVTFGNSVANVYNGRNYLESGEENVVSSDLGRFTVTNIVAPFEEVYTSSDKLAGTPVLEIVQPAPVNVKVTKTVVDAATTTAFPFEMSVNYANGDPVNLNTYPGFSLPSGASVKAGTTNVLTFSLKNGKDITFKALPNKAKVTLTETDTKGYKASTEVGGEKQDGAERTIASVASDITIDVINTKLVELKVSKTVAGITTAQKFPFEVSFADSTGAPVNITGLPLPTGAAVKSGTVNTVTFSLAHTDNVTISGVPYGTVATVTETSADGYTVSSKVGGQTASGAERTLTLNSALSEAAFTNTLNTQTVTVKKTVVDTSGKYSGGAFPFEATVTGTQISAANIAQASGVTANGNTLSFSLADGQSKALTVPAGCTVKVKETSHDKFIVSTKVGASTENGDTVTVSDVNAPANVEFINEYLADVSLTVKKHINGGGSGTFTFNVKVDSADWDPNTAKADWPAGASVLPDGTVTFDLTVTNGSVPQITIPQIPYGADVTVKETVHDGYVYVIKQNGVAFDGKLENVTSDQTVDVYNTPGADLPSAGGMGNIGLYVLGILLMAGAVTFGSIQLSKSLRRKNSHK